MKVSTAVERVPGSLHTKTREPKLFWLFCLGGGQPMVRAGGETAHAEAVSSAAMLDATALSTLAAQGFAGGGEAATMAQISRGWEGGLFGTGNVPVISMVAFCSEQASRSAARSGCWAPGSMVKME